MKSTIATQLLWSAAAVSALSLPNSVILRDTTVDLAQFGDGFQTITQEQAKADAETNNAEHADLVAAASSASKVTTETAAVDDGTVTTQAGSCTAPASRIEWRSLSNSGKTSFVNAVKCLMNLPPSGSFSAAGSQNRYEDLVAVHIQMVNSIHMVAQFLPWHRYYISVFESMLRDECAYTGPMPWWNEPLDAGNFANAPLFTSQWFGTAALASGGSGTCVKNGVSIHFIALRCCVLIAFVAGFWWYHHTSWR